MRRIVLIAGSVVLIAIIVFASWATQSHRATAPSGNDPMREIVRSAMTNSMALMKKEFTGGVGVMLRTGPGPTETMIQGVGVGSPGEQAGLRVGDIIVRVNDWPTAGRPL